MKKTILTILLMLSLSILSNAQGLMSHDFDDGTKGPFVVCTTKSPNYVTVENQRLKTYWTETGYDGSRMTKGAEACGDPSPNGIGYLTIKHCWLGFSMNIDNGYMADNPNTDAGLMQIFGFDDSIGYSSWTAMLDYKAGNLTWVDRRNLGNKTYALIYENFPKGVDVNIIVHTVLSANKQGMVEIFVDGVMRYARYNINIGMGEFNANDQQDWDSYTEFKIGQYNYRDKGGYDDSYDGQVWYDGYVKGEERIVYYDNISWYDGEDGYDLVDPTGTGCGGFDGFSTIEAESCCGHAGIDTEDCIEGGLNVGWINTGDWCRYGAVNFGNGAEYFKARVSSNTTGGNIEIRLDGLEGTLLGTCPVANTGGWQNWVTNSVAIADIDDVHDVFLVFTGVDAGYLFNVNWFAFTPNDGDFTFDGKVNMEDVAELSSDWHYAYLMNDLHSIAKYWLNGTAGTGIISVSFSNALSTPSTTSMQPTDLAGAPGVRVANWNNWFNGHATFGDDGQEVIDADGVPTGLLATMTPADRWSSRDDNHGNDLEMFSDVLDVFSSVRRISVFNVPYSEYEVYVYMRDDGSGRAGYFMIGDTTYYLRGGAGNPAGDGTGYVLSEDLTQGNSADIDQGNYVLFRGLTESGFTLVMDAINAGEIDRNKVAGFQIVEK